MARQWSDETIVVVPKRWAAKVLLPEPAGPHSTSRVRRGTFITIGIQCVLLPLRYSLSFDIIALHKDMLRHVGCNESGLEHNHTTSSRQRSDHYIPSTIQ